MKLENIRIKEDKWWRAILKNAVIYYRNKIANKVQIEVHICQKMKVVRERWKGKGHFRFE